MGKHLGRLQWEG